jgi:predicted transport protein
MLFKVTKGEAKKIVPEQYKLEKEIQSFVEENLLELLNLEVVKSEFVIEQYRMDTLAFDKENKSFIIIEYKRGSSYSVIDQGYSYLSTLLNNKADIILEYNERMNKSLKRDEVDWSQSRIIFISQTFTQFQRDSLNFKNLPIELYEIKKYDGDIVSFTPIKGKVNAESINTISIQNEEIKKVSNEIKVYTVEEHYKNSTEEIVELYKMFVERIENMIPDITVEALKKYIALKNNKKNLVDFTLQKNALKIWINTKKGSLNDFKNIMKDVSNVGCYGNGDYELSIKNDEDLEYILSMIKEANNTII